MYLSGYQNVPGMPGNTGGMLGGNPELAFSSVQSIADLGRGKYADLAGGFNPMATLRQTLDYGRRNIRNLYDATDDRLFNGQLPGGTQPGVFLDGLPKGLAPGQYNMPIYDDTGDGFIGPRTIDELKREIYEREREKRRYTSDPNLASTDNASFYLGPQITQAPPGFAGKTVS